MFPLGTSAASCNRVCANTITHPEILRERERESSLTCRYFPGSRWTTVQSIIFQWQRLCLRRTSYELSRRSNAYVRSFIRWMQPWLHSRASLQSSCLTASSLNKFSRSVEQTPDLRYKLLLALHIYEEYVIAFIIESTIGL